MADLFRARCLCKCHNPCGYGPCYPHKTWYDMMAPNCGHNCMTPKQFYIRFEGIAITTACISCLYNPPYPDQYYAHAFHAVGLSINDRNLKFNHSSYQNYWTNGFYNDDPLSGRFDGYLEFYAAARGSTWNNTTYQWEPSGAVNAVACIDDPTEYGYLHGHLNQGNLRTLVNIDDYVWCKLERLPASWKLTVEMAYEMRIGVSGVSWLLKLFEGTIPDASAVPNKCFKPMVIPNQLASVNLLCAGINGNFAPTTANIGFGGSAIITPCSPEVGL